MKYITTIFILGLFSLHLSSQDLDDFKLYHGCSSIKSYQAYLKNSKDIIQTPRLFDYDVKFYHLDLEIENNTTFIKGNVRYMAKVSAATLDTFAFELIDDMLVDSISINGDMLDFFRDNNEVFAILENSLDQDDYFNSVIYYHGIPPEGEFFNGVTMVFDSTWNKSVVWTLSEPFNARQWWPTKQVLDDKADSVWVFITTSAENKAGSIGILQDVVNLPDSKVRYEWKSNYPIAYYLISYAVSEYQEYNIYGKPDAMGGDSILIQNYIYDSPGCLEQHKANIDRTVTIIELLSDLYSLYPFYQEKYGHCLTKLSGGMEHQTMTTIGEGFGLGLVAHELAHMWFGNNVTCATWSDIWVNEGFATYTDYLAHEMIAGNHWPAKWLRQVSEYITSQPDGSVYVPPEEVAYGNETRIFSSRLTYFKGAYILHMIRYQLDDDELFFQVFKNYQNEFKDSIAVSDDFVHVLNETTETDFTEFFDQWFYGEGFPIYNIDWTQTDNEFEIISAQSPSAGEITPFFKMILPVKLFFDDSSDTTIEIFHTQPLEVKTVSIDKGVDSIQVDPDNWMLKKVVSINAISDVSDYFGFSLFPNPATEQIYISSDKYYHFNGSVIDIKGKTMFSFAAENFSTKLTIRNLEKGIYFIRLNTEKNKMIKKFIKI